MILNILGTLLLRSGEKIKKAFQLYFDREIFRWCALSQSCFMIKSNRSMYSSVVLSNQFLQGCTDFGVKKGHVPEIYGRVVLYAKVQHIGSPTVWMKS